jgi:membrane protease YdiL (CAAX protease family)
VTGSSLQLATRRYYIHDRVSKVLFMTGCLLNVYLLVWFRDAPEAAFIGILNLGLLFAGRLMYPSQQLGQLEDNPFRRRGYLTTLLVVTAGVFAAQYAVSTLAGHLRLGLGAASSQPWLDPWIAASAAISESYFLHWGIQTLLGQFLTPWGGVLGVALAAVGLHAYRYGWNPVHLAMVGASFLVLGFGFAYSARLSVPILAHMAVNLLPILAGPWLALLLILPPYPLFVVIWLWAS